MFRIVEDDKPPLPEGCSELLRDFLEQCFHKNPAHRPSADLLCEHMWLKKNWVELKVRIYLFCREGVVNIHRDVRNCGLKIAYHFYAESAPIFRNQMLSDTYHSWIYQILPSQRHLNSRKISPQLDDDHPIHLFVLWIMIFLLVNTHLSRQLSASVSSDFCIK